MYRIYLSLVISLITVSSISAQWLTGTRTYYNDDFSEWILYAYDEAADEELEGQLKMTWQLRGDWSEWDYSIDESDGKIKTVFRDDPSQWQIRANGTTITARRLFAGDWRQWRITDNTTSLVFKSKWGNNTDAWELRDEDHGRFDMSTEWEGDPRDWKIEDYTNEEITMPMKMMMVYIALYHSTPK